MRRNNRKFCAAMLAGTLIAGCRAGVPAFAETSTAAPTTYAESTVMESVVAETIEDETSSKDKKDTKEDTKKESRLKNEGLASVKTDDVETGANEFSKKVTYESYDPDDDITKHLPETVEANGETYNITEWKQPLVVSKEEVVPKTLSYESEVFTGDETEHEPDDEISYEDGTTYVLSSKELHEQSTKERSEYKESVVSYNGVEDGVQIKKKKDIEFEDVDTGQTVKATLDLVKETTAKEYWDDSFQFDITIHGYDADILVLNGKEIPKDADLMDYTDDLLEILNLDSSKYKINSIDLKAVEGDSDVRMATAYGSKYVKDIEATYGGTVTLPSVSGKTWSCIYEEKIPSSEKTIYTMSTTVSYEKGEVSTAETKSLFERMKDSVVGFVTAAYKAAEAAFKEHPVIASIPVIMIAAFIALLITRKVRNRCIYNEEMKCIYKKHNKNICKSCPHYRQRNKV